MLNVRSAVPDDQYRRNTITSILKEDACCDKRVESQFGSKVEAAEQGGTDGRPNQRPNGGVERGWENFAQMAMEREARISADCPGKARLPSLNRPDTT